jgi:putative ABC transport system permease protein
MRISANLRSLYRSPGESLLSVVALATGMGLVTTLFSVLHSVAFPQLPFPEPRHLTYIAANVTELDSLRAGQSSFGAMSGVVATGVNTVVHDTPGRYPGAYVSANFFTILGTAPAMGRTFELADEQDAAVPVAVISHKLWADVFRSDPAALGQTIRVGGEVRTIAGVMPRDFSFPKNETIWIPWRHAAVPTITAQGRGSETFILGRLKASSSVESAQTELSAIRARVQREVSPTAPVPPVEVLRFAERGVKGQVKVLLLAILAATLFVLLIACADVATIQLARTARRSQELAIRSALGASRSQIILLLLTETLALSVCGAAGGVAISVWTLDALWSFAMKEAQLTGGPAPWVHFGINPAVLAFAASVTVLSVIAAGLVPALRATRESFEPMLKVRQASPNLHSGFFSRMLVHVQLACSVFLLVGAGLVASLVFDFKDHVPYDTENVLTAQVSLEKADFPTPGLRGEFYRRVVQELHQTPGVEAAAVTSAEHIERSWSANIEIEGKPAGRDADRVFAQWQAIGGKFFDVFAVQTIQGRPFDNRDTAESLPVAMVNTAFVQRYWPNGDALGRRFRRAGQAWMTVVGVVPDLGSLKAAQPERRPNFYVPVSQTDLLSATLLVHTSQAASTVVPAVRAAITRVNPSLPLYQVHTAAELAAMEAVGIQLPGMLFATCGLSALFLGSFGAYGVLSLATRRRTQEVGVRLALGDSPAGILRLLLRQGSWQIVSGVSIGLVIAFLLARVLASIFGVFAHEFAVFAVVTSLMVCVAFAALAIPSWRAARMDPVEALRAE